MFMEMAEVEELLCQIDSSCYGGFYYDDNDAININILKNQAFDWGIDNPNVVYHTVKYSLQALMSYKNALSDALLGYHGIHMIYLSICENIINIGVDNDSDIILSAIRDDISKVYVPVDAYKIQKRHRFTNLVYTPKNPIVFDNSRILTEETYDYRHKIMAGGWLGFGSSSSSTTTLSHFSSVTCGFSYNNMYGIMTCGHGKTNGLYAFWGAPPPSSGTYPQSLSSYDPDWIVYFGKIVLVNYSTYPTYKYDFSSIKKITNTTIMAGTAYSGHTIAGTTGTPAEGKVGYFTGAANKKVRSKVLSISADFEEDMRGNKMRDLFIVNKPGNLGTSGGPFYYKPTGSNSFKAAGMACTTDSSETAFAKISHVKSLYNFTPIF